MLVPVDPVVEPVQDQQQHADRDHRDDRLELLAVERERAEHRLGDHPGDPGGDERERRAGQERTPVAAVDADHARHQRCEDQHRLEPLAEDDDGAVRDHGGRRAARADTLRRVLELGLQRRDRFLELGAGVLPLDELHEPGLSAVAVPEEALDPLEQRRRDPAQPLLRPELEDPVRLQPRLLRPAPAARLRGRREAVDRRCDDVEVGACGRLLPRIGVEVVDQLQSAIGAPADGLGGLRPAGDGGVQRAAERSDDGGQLAGRRRIAREQLRRDVRQRGGDGVAEADRLLDLECERDPCPFDAAVVLDRHESEETVELTRAAGLFGGRERRRPEPFEEADDIVGCSGERGGTAAGRGRLEALECALELGDGGVAALTAVARLDDRRVPARQRDLLGEPDGETAARSRDGVVQGSSQLRLVGVEQIGADRPRRGGRLRLALRERGHGEGGIRSRTGEAGGSPEVAHEQPLPSRCGVSVPRVGNRADEAGAEQRRPRSGASASQLARIAAGCGACTSQRGEKISSQGRGQLRRDRRQRRIGSRDERAGALCVTEDECGLRRAEVAPRVDGAGPPCGRIRACGRDCHRRGGECSREERRATHRYCWISMPSLAACCETWPATASPRACASVPSWSACSGVNRRPPCSCARRSPMNALSSWSSLPV